MLLICIFVDSGMFNDCKDIIISWHLKKSQDYFELSILSEMGLYFEIMRFFKKVCRLL